MKILAESASYQVLSEYEDVFLKFKETSKLVKVGDFYGDPEVAVISEEETFCAIGGCGVIVYFIREPFEEYTYCTKTLQWREWNRTDNEGILWVTDLACIDEHRIEIIAEDMRRIELNVNEAKNLCE